MKKLPLFLMFLFSVLFVEAQNTFSKIYNLSDSTGWFFADFERYIVDNDTIVGYGEAVRQNSDSTTNQGIFLYRIDSSGNAIDHIMHFDTLGASLAVEEDWGNIIAPSVGGYAALGATTGRNSFIFFKIKDDLSVEFIKEYPDTVNAKNFTHNIIEVKGGYIIWGIVQKQDVHFEIRVKYVDYSGEIIWEEKIQRSISNVIIDFERVNDSLFLMAVGHGDGIGNLISYSIEEFDLNQRFRTRWRSSQIQSPGFHLHVTHLQPDGDLLVFGSEATGRIFNSTIYTRILIKFDPNFIIKEKLFFGQPSTNIFARPDPQIRGFLNYGENLYGFGSSIYVLPDYPTGLTLGVLYNFSNDLDSLWLRNHSPLSQTGQALGAIFYNVDTLSSGNLIFMGITSDDANGNARGWVLKTPSDGCISPQRCDFTSAVSSVEAPTFEAKLHVFPNPTSDQLTIQFPESFGNSTLQVFNLTGQLIHQAQATMQYQFSTENMRSGVYLLKVVGENRITSIHKFRVTH